MRLREIALYVMFFSYSFYTVGLFLSPVYLLSLFAFILSLPLLNGYDPRSVLLIFVMLLFAIFSIYRIEFENINFAYSANLIASLLLIASYLGIYKKVDTNALVGIFTKSIAFFGVLFISDTFARVAYPPPVDSAVMAAWQKQGVVFYQFKSSWLFSDSNTVAISSLCILSVLFYFKKLGIFKQRVINTYVPLYVFLICASLSRAAIIGLTVLLFLSIRSSIVKISILVLGTMVASYVLSMLVIDDPSLNTKLDIYRIFYEYLIIDMEVDSLFFGLGVDQARHLFDRVPHSLFITVFVELGFVGLGLLLLLLFLSCPRRHPEILILPLLVSSLSYFPYYGMPFFYFLLVYAKSISDRVLLNTVVHKVR